MKIDDLTEQEINNFVKAWAEATRLSPPPRVETKVVKPIFTIGIFWGQLTEADFEEIKEDTGKKMPDYHVLLYSQNSSREPIFQAFYEKDFKHDEFEALKVQILEDLKTIKQ